MTEEPSVKLLNQKLHKLYKIIVILFVSLFCCSSYAQNAEDLFDKGQDAFSKNSLPEALGYFNDYVKASPDSSKGYIQRGNVLLLLKKEDDASQRF